MEGFKYFSLHSTVSTILCILRNGPNNCDASENRSYRTVHSPSTEKDARKFSQ